MVATATMKEMLQQTTEIDAEIGSDLSFAKLRHTDLMRASTGPSDVSPVHCSKTWTLSIADGGDVYQLTSRKFERKTCGDG